MESNRIRQFLLYTGPVVLRDVLDNEVYNNLLLVAIHVLASPSLC